MERSSANDQGLTVAANVPKITGNIPFPIDFTELIMAGFSELT